MIYQKSYDRKLKNIGLIKQLFKITLYAGKFYSQNQPRILTQNIIYII